MCQNIHETLMKQSSSCQWKQRTVRLDKRGALLHSVMCLEALKPASQIILWPRPMRSYPLLPKRYLSFIGKSDTRLAERWLSPSESRVPVPGQGVPAGALHCLVQPAGMAMSLSLSSGPREEYVERAAFKCDSQKLAHTQGFLKSCHSPECLGSSSRPQRLLRQCEITTPQCRQLGGPGPGFPLLLVPALSIGSLLC